MRLFLEFISLGLAVFSIGCLGIYFARQHFQQIAPEKCKHKHWTRWRIEDTQAIHLYAALDEGRSLPDRVDAYMTRECVRCGSPQARTVRGIDSQHFK